MPRTGRPKALDDEKRGQIRVLIAMGCKLKDVARYVGCAPCTLRRELHRNAEFRQEIADAKFGFETNMLHTVAQAAARNPNAANWLRHRLGRLAT